MKREKRDIIPNSRAATGKQQGQGSHDSESPLFAYHLSALLFGPYTRRRVNARQAPSALADHQFHPRPPAQPARHHSQPQQRAGAEVALVGAGRGSQSRGCVKPFTSLSLSHCPPLLRKSSSLTLSPLSSSVSLSLSLSLCVCVCVWCAAPLSPSLSRMCVCARERG